MFWFEIQNDARVIYRMDPVLGSDISPELAQEVWSGGGDDGLSLIQQYRKEYSTMSLC